MIIVMSNDQKYYLEATKEFDEGRLDEALWSKMLSVNQGDETKAKYSYIKQRAKELNKAAVRKSFSNSLDNFKKLIKRMLRPLFILAASALVIFGLIEAINYIRTAEERAAYEQQLEEQADVDRITKQIKKFNKEIAILKREEQERIAAEKIANATLGLDCVLKNPTDYRFNQPITFSLILNPMTLTLETINYNSDGFPEIVQGTIWDRETYYSVSPDGNYVGKPVLTENFGLRSYELPSYKLNKKDLTIDNYDSKCTPTDHNEIRERVRKEQESIRSEYKITN